jgi:cephalosporin hydroxylase
MKLKELWQKNQYSTDKESTHKYLDVYDVLFRPFYRLPIKFVEVGIADGGSLKLWDDYFIGAEIFGIDIKIANLNYKYSNRVHILETDINNLVIDASVIIDIAIDDGSHILSDQIAFIKLLWPVINKGGLLIVEDIDNIEGYKKDFDALNIPYEIIDLREMSGVDDSVLLIFKK